jgi:hypothetical protein
MKGAEPMPDARFQPPCADGKQAFSAAIGFALQLGASPPQLLEQRIDLGTRGPVQLAMLNYLVVQQCQIVIIAEIVCQSI